MAYNVNILLYIKEDHIMNLIIGVLLIIIGLKIIIGDINKEKNS